MTALQNVVRRAIAPLRARRGRIYDPNFIGFDKYRRGGAYHWIELDESADYRSKVEAVLTYVTAEAHCLDIGCGDGAYAYRVAQRAATIVGIDADTDAIRLARRELAARSAANVQCHQMAIGGLSLGALGVTRPFDVVYSMDVIEHLPNPTELVERALDVATSTAHIIIGTPLHLGDELVSPYHVREFRREELVALVGPRLHIDAVELLPMRRIDDLVHDEGFVVVVGRPRGGVRP